jgi:hypothetical protein
VTPAGRRAAALAVVAGVAIAIAVHTARGHGRHSTLPPGAGPWTAALAAPYRPAARTACGVTVTAETVGVGHPVLPCGARIYVRRGNVTVLTTVIDRGDVPPGRELNLTPKLAADLGVRGTRTVQWRFTR